MNDVLLMALAALAAVGALTVVLTRDVMRLGLGLGLFFVALAGLFAWYGLGFLALAEVFVYVGGVLVLVLFAIMLVHRSGAGSPRLDSRHDPVAAVSAAGIAAFAYVMLRPVFVQSQAATHSTEDLGAVLLGSMLPQFELAGVLLLAALVAVVSLAGGDRE